LQIHYGVPFVLAFPLAILAAGILSAAISMLAWRVAGLYLAIVTFGFGEIFQFLLVHADAITNGPDGLAIPKPVIFGHTFATTAQLFELLLSIGAVAIVLYRLFETSSLGLRMTALGDSETALASIGHEPRLMKTVAFGIQGVYAGCAGALFVCTVGFIDPYSFGLPETLMSLTAVAVGGLGSLVGSVIGGVTLSVVDQALIGFPGARELTYGLILLGIFMLFPSGLAGLWWRWRHR
jgi:branched-chain amino acid transport system permease protein